jgi:hypothetical protein
LAPPTVTVPDSGPDRRTTIGSMHHYRAVPVAIVAPDSPCW